MNSIKRILLLFSLIFLLLSVGGTFATWQYSTGSVDTFEEQLTFKIGDFFWEGSGDLPTDGDIGENHLILIDNIINHSAGTGNTVCRHKGGSKYFPGHGIVL